METKTRSRTLLYFYGLLDGGASPWRTSPCAQPARPAALRSQQQPGALKTYRSCWCSARRRTRSRCETSSSRTYPPRSPRCTAPAACRWCWSCWTWCRTTAWWWPARCRTASPLSESPRTSSWWWEPTRPGTTRGSSRWEPAMLSAAGLSP